MRINLIEEGKWDKIHPKQSKFTLDLKKSDIVQVAFKYSEDLYRKETIEWCTGTIKRLSEGNNLRNTTGTRPKFYRKGNVVKIKQLDNEANGEEVSTSIVEIKKKKFNCYIEYGWYMYYHIQQNNKILQYKFHIGESNTEVDLSPDNLE